MKTKINTSGPKRPKVLLTSVFGPYAQDDEYGSRKNNPMELYENQVTRTQKAFSLRMFHRSLALLLIQENINVPCTVLDYPDLDRFTKEVETGRYDIIGISGITVHIKKVEEMCRRIRKLSPNTEIIVGGHIANLENLENRIDVDHIVKGEGVRWFREHLGQDTDAPIKHPHVYSSVGTRILGLNVKESKEDVAASLIPSVGCPMGCNFCATSALFGGKGKFINFYKTGDELFEVMSGIEKNLQTKSFFVMDENFLFYKKRTLRLLELMEEHNKDWAIYVFASINVLKNYTMEQLLRLGVSWAWIGLEGEDSKYEKNKGINTQEFVKNLQDNGIRVLGSTILGMENHTPENIENVIEYATRYNTVFHQFMLYTPISGTPLYKELKEKGVLYPESEFPHSDAHGQFRFNYKHHSFKNGEEQKVIVNAFNKDFEVNGPSLARMIDVMIRGYIKHKNHPNAQVRARFEREIKPLKTTYAAAMWAMRSWYKGKDEKVYKKLDRILKDIYSQFGITTRIASTLAGPFVHKLIERETKKLENGCTIEPPTFYDKNELALALEPKREIAKYLKYKKKFSHVMRPVYATAKVK